MKILVVLFLLQSMMITGCHSEQNKESYGEQLPLVIFNGKKAILNEVQTQKLTDELNKLYSNCNDFYELLVTDELIGNLLKEEQFLEVIFTQKQVWNAGKFGDQEIQRILIPLSGSYASADQVTFFYGISDYSNTPLSISKGSAKLTAILQEIIQ